MMVVRSWPLPYFSARSASFASWSPETRPREDAGADRGEAGLALRRDADVVAVDIAGDVFILVGRGDQLVARASLRVTSR